MKNLLQKLIFGKVEGYPIGTADIKKCLTTDKQLRRLGEVNYYITPTQQKR